MVGLQVEERGRSCSLLGLSMLLKFQLHLLKILIY